MMRLTEQSAADGARRAGLLRSREEAAARQRRAEGRHQELAQRRQAALSEARHLSSLDIAEAAVAAAEHEAEAARDALTQAELKRAKLAEEETEEAARLRAAETQATQLAAEVSALTELLGGTDEHARRRVARRAAGCSRPGAGDGGGVGRRSAGGM